MVELRHYIHEDKMHRFAFSAFLSYASLNIFISHLFRSMYLPNYPYIHSLFRWRTNLLPVKLVLILKSTGTFGCWCFKQLLPLKIIVPDNF